MSKENKSNAWTQTLKLILLIIEAILSIFGSENKAKKKVKNKRIKL